jgi:CDP-ribitol ribitolphosphotransferase
MPDVKGLADALDPGRFILIVKLHPLYRTEDELPQADNIIYDEEFTSYEWLALADAIISDYSSLVVEASLADKPMYLYTYDIDAYSETTGLNMDFSEESIAPYVFRDPAELAAALDRPYDMEALRSFRDKYIDIDTDNCTSQLADMIINL